MAHTAQEICWYAHRLYVPEALPLGLNRGLSFGDGLFETIRLVNGQPLLISLHRQRMERGQQALNLYCSPPPWEDVLPTLWKAAGEPAHARLKWLVFRQGSGAYLPEAEQGACLLSLRSLPQDPYCTGEPVRLTTQTGIVPPTLPGGLGKTLSSLHYVLAAQAARKLGADHALLMDGQGQLLECEHANIGCLKSGTLQLCNRGIAGTQQAFLQQQAKALQIPCVAGPLSLPDLLEADLTFITNSIIGYRTVCQIDGHTLAIPAYTEELLKRICRHP
ncbi:MAG: aminotransferase class IV [Bacteroidetes bacterium]|nr:aminotransferase class IV [Bacteroidota bacterium]